LQGPYQYDGKQGVLFVIDNPATVPPRLEGTSHRGTVHP
jgi:hypothetical protein